MTWNVGLELIETNLGFNLEIILLIIVVSGGLVFYALSFIIGNIIELVLSTLCFMFAYYYNVNWQPALICMLLFFVMLCISLYLTSKATEGIT